ncbi:peroxiredoxin family protein [Spirosoma rhododendri]|uniref:TlpA family protein disulfide reductase n=1 Tax=Spirosoma rhododendri TaxID=2728024 RepID=A0A7L5DSI9_9BACT|nr:TlpA disulfide reductase family protein [Spirosoma rhododendri]QJD78550.1 TlpA family protein disulfide reductase [Spirosoma rhododendri]
MRFPPFSLLIGLAGLAFSCSGQSQPTPVKSGTYRATLQTKGGQLPFGLAIEPGKQANTYAVFAINGTERLAMDSATVTGDSIRIPMALFDSELVAKIDGSKLTGTWRRHRTAQQTLTLPFQAELGPTYRFVPDAKSAKNTVAGTWATEFSNKRNQVDTVNAVGVFKQSGNRVSGTFLTPTGDYRYLDGNAVGDSLFLSCFDGSHLFLFKAKHDPATKMLTGGFWAGISGYESWVAKADPTAKLPDPATLTYLKPGSKTLTVSFPEPSGNVVSLTDPRYKGKVTVVQIMGSWCPNCMDETNFLSPWYKKNRQRGVEILGLSFERSAEMNESGPKIERMKQRFKIDYPIVLAGTNDKAKAAKALPDLNAVVAFPTTIILDKAGKVRQIYTGFSGPGTGKYYDQYVDEFNRLIDKLLAES